MKQVVDIQAGTSTQVPTTPLDDAQAAATHARHVARGTIPNRQIRVQEQLDYLTGNPDVEADFLTRIVAELIIDMADAKGIPIAAYTGQIFGRIKPV